MVKRNKERKMLEEEGDEGDAGESAQMQYLREEHDRGMKTKEHEMTALQEKIKFQGEERKEFVHVLTLQMKASCSELEKQLKQTMEQQNEEQPKQMADETKMTLQLKEEALHLQREKEMQEYTKQKQQMKLSQEQIKKTYEQKMEHAKQEMAQEMAQQKSIEMLAFFSALENKKRKQLIENAPDITAPGVMQEVKEITELESQI